MMRQDEMLRAVDEAGFVFRGTVVGDDATGDIGEGAADRTVVVSVEEVSHGTDVLRDLVGRNVVVVSDDPAVEPGSTHIFYTNCVSLGDPVVAQELARDEVTPDSTERLAEAVRIIAELPIAERVAAADLVVAGEVTDSAPLDTGPPVSEHDPDWWVANVVPEGVMKGRTNRKRIPVLFANSLDIAWYRSPKLHEGVRGVFLLHTRAQDETFVAEAPSAAYQVTDPHDLLPFERIEDVQRMVEPEPEES